jgi:hypothetical protein
MRCKLGRMRHEQLRPLQSTLAQSAASPPMAASEGDAAALYRQAIGFQCRTPPDLKID